LLISASGDVGTADDSSRAELFSAALNASGIGFSGPGDAVAECYFGAIEHAHRQARQNGVEHPEVEITEIWRETLAVLAERGLVEWGAIDGDLRPLAVEYEVRANPTWPMPHMLDTLDRLRAGGFPLGIISNAQFFTLELFPALTGQTVAGLGFPADLQYYSYRRQVAKPDEQMYRLAREALAARGIAADQVLHVGNDMLSDVTAAHKVGFRTALFAGDARSLRLRQGDPRVAGLTADAVLTGLADLGRCLNLA
jgi:putative hydrolase of the HAD superfamily